MAVSPEIRLRPRTAAQVAAYTLKGFGGSRSASSSRTKGKTMLNSSLQRDGRKSCYSRAHAEVAVNCIDCGCLGGYGRCVGGARCGRRRYAVAGAGGATARQSTGNECDSRWTVLPADGREASFVASGDGGALSSGTLMRTRGMNGGLRMDVSFGDWQASMIYANNAWVR